MSVRILQRFTREESEALTSAIADHLGVDMDHIPDGITAEWVGGASPIVVSWQAVTTIDPEVFDALLDNVRAVVDNPPTPPEDETSTEASTPAETVVDDVTDTVTDTTTDAAETVTDTAQNVTNTVGDTLGGLFGH